LSLKSCQKIKLLTSYIFLRYIYSTMIYPPCEGVLKNLDNEIRQEIKGILHLLPSTAIGLFYTPKANGDLGLPRSEYIIKLLTLINEIRFTNSPDPVVSSLIGSGGDKKLKKIAISPRINRPATLEDIEKAKKILKREHIKQWADLRSQGHGVGDFAKEKIGNEWLRDYSLLKPSRFIDAVRLGTNTLGTKTVLARADKKINMRESVMLSPKCWATFQARASSLKLLESKGTTKRKYS
jgi:hypothetical protein